MPQTWVFLAKAKTSGSTPKCSIGTTSFPVVPKPVCTSSKMSRNVVLRRRARRSSARNSAPEVVVAALALDRLDDQAGDVVPGCWRTPASISAIAWCSSATASASSASVVGNASFGFTTRGQPNLGNYWVLRGSAVLVSDSV